MADHRRDAGGGIGGALPPVPPPPASIAGKPPPPPPLASRFSSRSNSRGSSRGGSLEPAKPGTVAEESPRRPRRRSSINAAEISSLTAEMETYENREKQLREREAAGQADRNSLEEALAKMADIEKEIVSSNHELTSLKEELPMIKALEEQLVHKVETSNDPALTNKMLRRISYDLKHEIVHSPRQSEDPVDVGIAREDSYSDDDGMAEEEASLVSVSLELGREISGELKAEGGVFEIRPSLTGDTDSDEDPDSELSSYSASDYTPGRGSPFSPDSYQYAVTDDAAVGENEQGDVHPHEEGGYQGQYGEGGADYGGGYGAEYGDHYHEGDGYPKGEYSAGGTMEAKSDWIEAQDPETGHAYWWNQVTNETSWDPFDTAGGEHGHNMGYGDNSQHIEQEGGVGLEGGGEEATAHDASTTDEAETVVEQPLAMSAASAWKRIAPPQAQDVASATDAHITDVTTGGADGLAGEAVADGASSGQPSVSDTIQSKPAVAAAPTEWWQEPEMFKEQPNRGGGADDERVAGEDGDGGSAVHESYEPTAEELEREVAEKERSKAEAEAEKAREWKRRQEAAKAEKAARFKARHDAASTIQARARDIQRRHREERNRAAGVLQASTRRKLHARRCREGVAAVVLQSTSRRISAKAVVARAREAKRVEEAAAKRQAEELLAAQTAAVVVLQTRCVRGHQARAMLRTAKAAVLRLQCSHRQRAARRVYEAAWEVHCRSRAALVIQCGYRQYTARQVYATLVAAAWELHSALIVQCGYRQYVARQVYAKHVIAAWEAYNRTQAATRLQCRHRQRVATSDVGVLREQRRQRELETASAFKVQGAYRCLTVRRVAAKRRRAAELIALRGQIWIACKQAKELRHRRKVERMKAARARATLQIECWWRVRLARREYEARSAAVWEAYYAIRAIKLQSVARGWKGRREALEERRRGVAAVVTQSAFRVRLARRRSQVLRGATARLQGSARVWKARRTSELLRQQLAIELELAKRQEEAALVIQCCQRQREAQRVAAVAWAAAWEVYSRNQAALRIQCCQRQRAAQAVYMSRVAAAWEVYNRNQAALRIQCCQRQRTARGEHASQVAAAWEVYNRNQAALRVQCCQRQRLARNAMLVLWAAAREVYMALRIQCSYRQRVARQAYAKRVAAAWEAYNRNSAALQIQCSRRQRMARRVYEVVWQANQRDQAALAIQCSYLQYAARKVYKARMAAAWEEFNTQVAALVIVQCAWRQHLSRRRYAARVQSAWDSYYFAAAVKLQGASRSKRARATAEALRQERDARQLAAALVVQSGVRGWNARSCANAKRQQRDAAAVVQLAVRSCAARRRVSELRQAAEEARQARQHNAVVGIQTKWRGTSVRKRKVVDVLRRLHRFAEVAEAEAEAQRQVEEAEATRLEAEAHAAKQAAEEQALKLQQASEKLRRELEEQERLEAAAIAAQTALDAAAIEATVTDMAMDVVFEAAEARERAANAAAVDAMSIATAAAAELSRPRRPPSMFCVEMSSADLTNRGAPIKGAQLNSPSTAPSQQSPLRPQSSPLSVTPQPSPKRPPRPSPPRSALRVQMSTMSTVDLVNRGTTLGNLPGGPIRKPASPPPVQQQPPMTPAGELEKRPARPANVSQPPNHQFDDHAPESKLVDRVESAGDIAASLRSLRVSFLTNASLGGPRGYTS